MTYPWAGRTKTDISGDSTGKEGEMVPALEVTVGERTWVCHNGSEESLSTEGWDVDSNDSVGDNRFKSELEELFLLSCDPGKIPLLLWTSMSYL